MVLTGLHHRPRGCIATRGCRPARRRLGRELGSRYPDLYVAAPASALALEALRRRNKVRLAGTGVKVVDGDGLDFLVFCRKYRIGGNLITRLTPHTEAVLGCWLEILYFQC